MQQPIQVGRRKNRSHSFACGCTLEQLIDPVTRKRKLVDPDTHEFTLTRRPLVGLKLDLTPASRTLPWSITCDILVFDCAFDDKKLRVVRRKGLQETTMSRNGLFNLNIARCVTLAPSKTVETNPAIRSTRS
jgi:hypothetical protein